MLANPVGEEVVGKEPVARKKFPVIAVTSPPVPLALPWALIQRIPGLWSSVGTRQCLVPTGIYRSGMYFINVESAVNST